MSAPHRRLGGAAAVLLGAATLFVPSTAWAGGGSHGVIYNIALCLVAACGCALVMRLFRQSALLGYLIAGVLIGPVGLELITSHEDITTLASIGLILLLFVIGLEIDLHKMRNAGAWVLVPGLLQFPICVGLSYAAFAGLEELGFFVGTGTYARLYGAIAISLSSTMVAVKLLFDNSELDTLAGRITIGVLVFQDIWAIIVLAIQPNLNDPQVLGIARTFAAGAVVVAGALALSRWVLPVVFKRVAEVPELMLVVSLGWCFLVSLVAAHPFVGLSMEMGALIAGVSLATFPYSLDVIAKAMSIRDFFITLFFVALGMRIPLPTVDALTIAGLLVATAFIARLFGVAAILHAIRAGHHTGIVATLNLAQVSEFSLVILSIGIGLGHIDDDTLTPVIWVFAFLAAAAPTIIGHAHSWAAVGTRVLNTLHIRDRGRGGGEEVKAEGYDIVLLGFYRIASAMLAELRNRYPELVDKLQVVDFNPEAKKQLDALGVHCIYGDISHVDTLHHAHIDHAKVIVCSIPDSFLRGTDNAKLLTMLRRLAPHARIVVTSETLEQARALYAQGADYVLEAAHVAGSHLAEVVEQSLIGDLPQRRASALEALTHRQEVAT